MTDVNTALDRLADVVEDWSRDERVRIDILRSDAEEALATVRAELQRLQRELGDAKAAYVAQKKHTEVAEAELQRLQQERQEMRDECGSYARRVVAAEAGVRALQDRLREADGVVNGVIWLDNNIHNYGTDAWRDYFKAVLRDARRARALLADRPSSDRSEDSEATT